MISKKVYLADGSTNRFLGDFIIRSEQYARPYIFIYDDTLASDGTEDVLQGGTTDQADWSYPDNLWRRGTNIANSNDITTVDKWQVVDNSILYYEFPPAGSTIWLEIATTSEEFGSTLTQPSVERAELAAAEAASSAAEALSSAAEAAADLVLTNEDVIASGVNATDAELSAWDAEAARLTADSYALEAEDTPVNIVTSDGDGTFTYTPTSPPEYSSLHYAAKAEGSDKVAKSGDTMTGDLELKGTAGSSPDFTLVSDDLGLGSDVASVSSKVSGILHTKDAYTSLFGYKNITTTDLNTGRCTYTQPLSAGVATSDTQLIRKGESDDNDALKVDKTSKDVANGYAGLDSNTRILDAVMPVTNPTSGSNNNDLAVGGTFQLTTPTVDTTGRVTETLTSTVSLPPMVEAIGNINNKLLSLPAQNSLAMTTGTGSATFTRATTATHIDRYGTLVADAINEPIFEKNGFLTYGASTNISSDSEGFDDNTVYPLNNGITRGSLIELAPDGISTNAVEFIPAAGVGSWIGKGRTPSGTGYHTESVFVKKGGGDLNNMALLVPAAWFTEATNPFIEIDFTTGETSIGGDTFNKIYNHGVDKLTNGWFRIYLTCIVDTAVSGGIQYRYTQTDADGTTDSFILWGAQAEALPFPTSYIPTTTTAVTRSYDALSVDYYDNQPNIDEDATFIIRLPEARINPTGNSYLLANHLSSNDFLTIVLSAAGSIAVGTNSNAEGSLFTQSAANSVIDGMKTTVAVTFTSGICKIYINGVLVKTGTAVHKQQVVYRNQLSIGGYREDSDIQRYFSHISADTYQKALTATEIALIG